MNKIEPILEGIYNSPQLRKKIVPLFLGDPGLGKTVIIKDFAKKKGVKLVEMITSQRNPFEISGMAMPDKDIKRMSFWDFDTLLDMKDGDILFFDELLNGNPVTLNACLTILEERTMISGKPLPDIMIVAAANPQGMLPLTPQIKERFVWYTVNFDKPMWKEYIYNKFGLNRDVSEEMCSIIKNEKFTGGYNFNTPRSFDKAIDSIVRNVNSPYENILLPILNKFVENDIYKEITEPIPITENISINPGEKLTHLKLIQYKLLQDGIITEQEI